MKNASSSKASVFHVAFQLGHVDAVGRKAAHGLVERRRQVADPEHEAGDAGSPDWRLCWLGVRRHDQKARGVVVGVLDVAGQDVEAVDLCGQRRGYGCAVRIGMVGQHARRPGGIADGLRFQTQATHGLATLMDRDGHALDRLQLIQLHAGVGHQLEVDGLEPLTDDFEARRRQQVVHVGHAARDGILHRDHAQLAIVPLDRLERLLERRVWDGFHVGKGRRAGLVAVRTQLPLKSDSTLGHGRLLAWARA